MAGTTPTDADGPTGRLATWLAETSVDAIPTEVSTTRARHLILDGIGCLLVGARLPWSRIAVQSLTVEPGASVVAGWDRTASAGSRHHCEAVHAGGGPGAGTGRRRKRG